MGPRSTLSVRPLLQERWRWRPPVTRRGDGRVREGGRSPITAGLTDHVSSGSHPRKHSRFWDLPHRLHVRFWAFDRWRHYPLEHVIKRHSFSFHFPFIGWTTIAIAKCPVVNHNLLHYLTLGRCSEEAHENTWLLGERELTH